MGFRNDIPNPGETSDNRLTLEDFLSRTFPFALFSRGQAYLYPWSGEGSSSWEYHITLRLNRGLQAPGQCPQFSISNAGTKIRNVKHYLKLFLKDNSALLCNCLAWNVGVRCSQFGSGILTPVRPIACGVVFAVSPS